MAWAIAPATQGSPAPPMVDPAFSTPMAVGASSRVVNRGAIAMVVGKTGPRKKPTEAEEQEFEKLKRQSEEFANRWEDLQRHDLAAFQKLAAGASLSTVVVPPAGREMEEPVPAH